MEKLFPSKANLTDKISYYHLLFFLASLPFDRFYSHIILASFTLHSLLNFKKGKQNRISLLQFFLLISVFIVTILSTIYSFDSKTAFNDWVKQITILLFPIVFWLSGFDLKKYRDALLYGFSMVCVAVVVFLYINAFYVIRYFHLPISEIIKTPFVNHNFSQPIDMHATFLSLQLSIALIYLFSTLLKQTKLVYRLLYSICILILFAGVVQLSSKSILFCLLIGVDVLVPLYLLQGRKRRRFMLVAYSITLLGLLTVMKLSAFKERFITDLKTDLTEEKFSGQTSESRATRWATVKEIVGQAPIIGHGAGTEVELLHEAFWKKKYYNSFLYNLNSHNEYLSFMVKSGIIGLLIYLATLISGFRLAIKRRDYLFLLFMTLIAIVSLSENILDVDKGIIFYAFFFSFFLFSSGDAKVEKSTVER